MSDVNWAAVFVASMVTFWAGFSLLTLHDHVKERRR